MSARTSALIFGRDASDGQTKPYNWNRGAMDVYIQDQTTPLVNYIFKLKTNDVVLDGTALRDSNTIELVAGHGAAPGQMLTLFSGVRYYQGLILGVVVNTISLDSPLPFSFPSGTIASVGTPNANVNGNISRKIFIAKPPPGVQWDIAQLAIYMSDNAAMDNTTFGGIAALSKGVVLRSRNGDWYNVGNVKRNGDFKVVGCDTDFATKVGGGEYSFSAVCQFSKDAGVALRLNGQLGDQLELLIQDDLTAITQITAVAIGHVVE